MKMTFFVSNVPKPIIITTDDHDKEKAKDLIQKAISNSLVLCVENDNEFAIIRGSTINFVLGHSAGSTDLPEDEIGRTMEGVRISIPDSEDDSDDTVEVN